MAIGTMTTLQLKVLYTCFYNANTDCLSKLALKKGMKFEGWGEGDIGTWGVWKELGK